VEETSDEDGKTNCQTAAIEANEANTKQGLQKQYQQLQHK
jgi:hypothetical protein